MANTKELLSEDNINEYTKLLYESCIENQDGGPFGAVVFKDGEVVGVGFNNVLRKNDPTAHAEMEAIRNACSTLNTFDLSGCELYATGYPCPMCMSAIIWANIKKVYYSANYKDAAEIGFRDDHIFKFIKNNCKDENILSFEPVYKDSIVDLYKRYKEEDKEMY